MAGFMSLGSYSGSWQIDSHISFIVALRHSLSGKPPTKYDHTDSVMSSLQIKHLLIARENWQQFLRTRNQFSPSLE